MVEYASAKLDDLRCRMPEAAGLVIAPSIEMAEYFVKLIEKYEGDKPEIVHNDMTNAQHRIEKFRHSKRRWIVSVAMVSEGVDIPRLRVLLYLPKAQTELAFRQALGRVVRSAGEDDDTRAYVVMPSFKIFEEYARRVEEEMSEEARKEKDTPTTKKCPSCTSEVPRGTMVCGVCGHEFPKAPPRFKTCPKCEELNPIRATECQVCGEKFGSDFVITLNEALRIGAIVRGVDVEEDEAREGEAMAGDFRSFVMREGDAQMLKIAKMVPDELLGRFASFMDSVRRSKDKE
ncbi:MAG TPA: helicase-related protein [Caulobacteraceae bacterium]